MTQLMELIDMYVTAKINLHIAHWHFNPHEPKIVTDTRIKHAEENVARCLKKLEKELSQ